MFVFCNNSLSSIDQDHMMIPYWIIMLEILKPWSELLDSDSIDIKDKNLLLHCLSITKKSIADIYSNRNNCHVA
jgi:hypothetical protein